MDGRVREPREPAPLVHHQDLDAVGVGQIQCGVEYLPNVVGTDGRRHHRTPTWTPRKRAGDAACPTRAAWPGWPFPQFGVP